MPGMARVHRSRGSDQINVADCVTSPLESRQFSFVMAVFLTVRFNFENNQIDP